MRTPNYFISASEQETVLAKKVVAAERSRKLKACQKEEQGTVQSTSERRISNMARNSVQKNDLQKENKRREENLAAQRAAVEAMEISRATLETTLVQEEQLEHCESLQERTNYVVSKSERIVRGMTWSGWMANMFSKDVAPPMDRRKAPNGTTRDDNTLGSILEDTDAMDVPERLWDQARIVKNYECNVLLLENCQNRDEFNMCLDICKKLNASARKSLNAAANNGGCNRNDDERLDGRSIQFLRKFEKKLNEVENVQSSTVQRMAGKFKGQAQLKKNAKDEVVSSVPIKSRPIFENKTWVEQDEHLDILAGNMQELLHNGLSIGSSLEKQNELLETLDNDTDDLTEQTKMVSRRADRLVHRSMWRSPPSDFKCRVAIEHVVTKKYLSIEPHNNKKISLHEFLHPELSVFEVYERRGSKLIGFKNLCTKTWLGQSTLGYIVCNAKKFGRNEEWELDDNNMTRTKMLCASANWGNGGWLQVNEKNDAFTIVNYGLDGAKEKASIWSVIVVSDAE